MPCFGVPRSPYQFSPEYIVKKVGTYYHVIKDQSLRPISYSSLEVALNDEAFNGLTAGRLAAMLAETILLKGNLNLDGKIIVPSYVNLLIDGLVTLDDGVNTHMIETAGDITDGVNGNHTDGVSIIGQGWMGGLNANKVGQAGTCHCIHTKATGGTNNNNNINIQNLKISSVRNEGIYLETCDAALLDRLWLNNCDGRGIRTNGIYDSFFHRLTMNYIAEAGIELYNGRMNILSDIYLGGTSYADGQLILAYLDPITLFNNVFVDTCGSNGVYADHIKNVSMKNLNVSGTLAAANTKDALQLLAGVTYCDFDISVLARGGLNAWRYGVNEVATSDYNVIYAKAFQNCTTANSLITGVHSKFNVGWTP